MGFRVKRYGPFSTMVVVGSLEGTFEPALVIVTMAQANSTNAMTNTIAPSPPAGRSAGRNGKGTSQLSASPAMTTSPPRKRRPNNHLSGVCRLIHSWTVTLRSLSRASCRLAYHRRVGDFVVRRKPPFMHDPSPIGSRPDEVSAVRHETETTRAQLHRRYERFRK